MSSLPINPEQLLADGFAHYAHRWAEERGASKQVRDVIRQAASLVSQATSAGHVCVHLRQLEESIDRDPGQTITASTLRDMLLESQLVGSPAEPGTMPLILDGDGRLYLHRYFDYEKRLARCLAARRGRKPVGVAGDALPPNVTALLNALFDAGKELPEGSADWQKIAVITALLGNVTILSGGPGTGKTTAIVNLLACLVEEKPACRIALAAPTGKAAARITETIRQRAGHLPNRIIARLPQESFTVHRLLGVLPDGGFRHHAENPLPIDVLIVDEASMLDLALATQLFEAVPPDARIILVGDKDQLAAVESGAVFAELSADPTLSAERVRLLARICAVGTDAIQSSRPAGGSGLTDAVVWLRQNYRFAGGSPIGMLAAEINAGDAESALGRLRNALPDASMTQTHQSLAWFNDGSAMPSKDTLGAICGGYAQYVAAFRTDVLDPRMVIQAFGRFRTLCAVRDGYRGTHAINQLVSTFFRREIQHSLDPGPRSDWYPGRPVIVLRNDYVLELFNGDIGIVLPDGDGRLMVYFPDQASGFRAIPPGRLPEHETAFAMTVHKAQGSEFDTVLVLLPSESNRILTRELLYTGVTRARLRVIIMGSANAIESAIRAATERLSGLFARLREMPGK